MAVNVTNMKRLASWSEDVRVFLGDDIHKAKVEPYVRRVLLEQTKQSVEQLFARAVAALCLDDHYNTSDGTWYDAEAKALWLRGRSIRDEMLDVGVPLLTGV